MNNLNLSSKKAGKGWKKLPRLRRSISRQQKKLEILKDLKFQDKIQVKLAYSTDQCMPTVLSPSEKTSNFSTTPSARP